MKTSILDYPAINKGPGIAKRIFQGIIFLVSMGIIYLLVRIVFFYEVAGPQDGSVIPVIKASETALWIKPLNPGGKESKHTGYRVNVLVHGDPFNEEWTTIDYAPPPVELPVDLRSLNAKGVPLYVEEVVEEGDTMVARTGREILEDFFTQLEEGTPPMEIEANTPETVITARQDEGIAQVNAGRELSPNDVPEGEIIAHIGSYANQNLASNKWREIMNKFPKDLGSKDWMVKSFTGSTSVAYRLYAIGFNSEDEADSFCARIEAGGHPSCIRTLMNQ